MAWTYEQKFNDLNNGDLNGQDNWGGAGDWDVNVGYTPFEGTKCIKCTTASNEYIYDTGDLGDGNFYFAMKADDCSAVVSYEMGVRTDNASNYFGVVLQDDAFDFFSNGGSGDQELVASPDDDTWYIFNLEWNAGGTVLRCRWKKAGGTWSGWTNATWTAGQTIIQRIRLFSSSTGVYLDTITPTDPTLPVAKPRSFGSII